jgi:phosphonatase-like hydrolase
MKKHVLRLAMFDMAGTTVDDRVEGEPLVIRAVRRALAQQGITSTPEAISAHRGKQKRTMLADLLEEANTSPALVDKVYPTFIEELRAGLDGVNEMAGTSDLFRMLQRHGVRVGVGSGFPTDVVEGIVDRLGWAQDGLVDFYASANQVGAGRPSPKMIHVAMKRFTLADERQVVKVGDTIMDIQEGRNAGVWTVAVLSGTQKQARLEAAGPDALLPDIAALPDWLDQRFKWP